MTSALFVIMGPSGCGKSTVGQALAKRLDITFLEGDDYHPQSNRAKMARGEPLDDADRKLWLDSILRAASEARGPAVLACSALTQYVQQRLIMESQQRVIFCLLELDQATLEQRVANRADHFMPAGLVASQLTALSVPIGAMCFSGDQPVPALVEAIVTASRQRGE